MVASQHNKQPILVQRGGVWFPYSIFVTAWMTWPFGRLSVFSDHFEVNGARFTIQNVTALERIRGLFSTGLRIVHSNSNTAKEIVFWSSDFASLRAALEYVGFRITEPSEEWRKRQRIAWALTLFVWIVMAALFLCLVLWTGEG